MEVSFEKARSQFWVAIKLPKETKQFRCQRKQRVGQPLQLLQGGQISDQEAP
jgi:hypothetical protein